jgi:prevent-host-death family protein
MKVVSKMDLQANPSDYFQEVESSGEDLIVTNNGRPVLKIVACRQLLSVDEVFADVQGKIRYHGDLLEPTTDEWALSG